MVPIHDEGCSRTRASELNGESDWVSGPHRRKWSDSEVVSIWRVSGTLANGTVAASECGASADTATAPITAATSRNCMRPMDTTEDNSVTPGNYVTN